MKVVEGSNNICKTYRYPVITFGNFDGVHKGHQKILEKVIAIAKANHGTSILYTFDPHPVKILAPDLTPHLLQTKDQKISFLGTLGLDLLIVEPFNKKLAALTAELFFKKILIKNIQPKEIVVGYDFTFGLHRSGKIEDLERMASLEGIKVHVVDAIFHRNSLLSSTHIRHFIETGNLKSAKEMLGRPYSIEGTVIKGRGIGAELGFHTANLKPDNELLPPPGVYITKTAIKGGTKEFKSITNIGYNPTFGGTKLSVETYLLDFKGSLLGKHLKLEFLDKIRREMTFETMESLRDQIAEDVSKTREYYEKRI